MEYSSSFTDDIGAYVLQKASAMKRSVDESELLEISDLSFITSSRRISSLFFQYWLSLL